MAEHRTSLADPRAHADEVRGSVLPAAPEGTDLRQYLPGVEPERRLNDWGRSERVEGALDRTINEFLYRYWFRVDVEGVEHVPAEGGALLVSNHAGALPPDAPMIAKAIKEEHPRPRPLYLTMEHFFKGYPGFSMLLPKVGGVAAHPANVHRLLYDEGELLLVVQQAMHVGRVGGHAADLGHEHREERIALEEVLDGQPQLAAARVLLLDRLADHRRVGRQRAGVVGDQQGAAVVGHVLDALDLAAEP